MSKKKTAAAGPRRVSAKKVNAGLVRKVKPATRRRTKLTELLSELLKPEHDSDDLPFENGRAFVATLVVSDDRATRAAFAVGYRASEEEVELAYLDAAPASASSSTQHEAAVLGVHRIVHQAAPRANVLIETSNDYIVRTVNTLRLDWRENRWKNKKGDSVAYAPLWKGIDGLILQKALEIKAVHIPSEDAKRNKIMIILKDFAQSGREHHGRPPRKQKNTRTSAKA